MTRVGTVIAASLAAVSLMGLGAGGVVADDANLGQGIDPVPQATPWWCGGAGPVWACIP